MRATAAALAFLAAVWPAGAATITATVTPDNRPALLIEGPIVEGDQYQLDQVWAANPSVQVVILNSPGGLILPALRIGDTIRRGGLATVVMPGELCASACGDIWLAGIHRILPEGARVGFHGIYGNDGKTLTMTGAGNGLVGAYLARMGYSDSTVVLATAERPEGMAWITSHDTINSAGLSFETLPPKELRVREVRIDGELKASEVPRVSVNVPSDRPTNPLDLAGGRPEPQKRAKVKPVPKAMPAWPGYSRPMTQQDLMRFSSDPPSDAAE
ncbi:hypothetical protein [Lichenibacterium dinghuense]|uniref:COG3904 family protein n=1 Tax=Lichenibacterium dinghuense TaxID=2895977 RepID=UPI001F24C2FE|nr:hypothetical protein [Lichenibacterium sp. 6Y81]